MSKLLTLVWPEKSDLVHHTQTMSQQDGRCKTFLIINSLPATCVNPLLSSADDLCKQIRPGILLAH